ncbi:MAG: hypothetical protein F4Z65_08325 [Acidobacteria bacterium]|nr:hypothetical protein [Acidobacteriota bacterium]MYA45094.1 hypothetical protein [Acidobacteriota bacterium]MYI37811.1 hypothetical protein [Acidobacteriota bacterium]
MTRKPASGPHAASVLPLLFSLAAAGCATTSGPRAIPPDAAAIHAAERARGSFEDQRPLVEDPDLTARITAIGREALAGTPLLSGREGEAAPLREGWRFAVLDDPEPEAFLFADRTVFVSRGALAALPGEPALALLFRSAATTFASGAFRPETAGELVEQPLSLVLPAEPAAGSPADGAPSRDRWVDLLDGLLFGEPAEYGVADGQVLLLPRADFRLSLPDRSAFEPAERGVFRATRNTESVGLTVRETPAAGPGPVGGNGVTAHRAELADLGARLREAAAREAAELTFPEAFRVRGFTGVRGRLHPAREGDPGEASRQTPGLMAVVPAGESLVEVSLDCGRWRFDACEAWFLEVLGSADRLWDTPVPGPLRITAVAAGESGSVREALGRLAAAGRIDAGLPAVEFLNRGWLEEPLGPGERVLILSRNPAAAAADSGGRQR